MKHFKLKGHLHFHLVFDSFFFAFHKQLSDMLWSPDIFIKRKQIKRGEAQSDAKYNIILCGCEFMIYLLHSLTQISFYNLYRFLCLFISILIALPVF